MSLPRSWGKGVGPVRKIVDPSEPRAAAEIMSLHGAMPAKRILESDVVINGMYVVAS
jgi:hypothetical protein